VPKTGLNLPPIGMASNPNSSKKFITPCFNWVITNHSEFALNFPQTRRYPSSELIDGTSLLEDLYVEAKDGS
jgi:hypothetical protein